MGTYRKEWECCGSVTETEAWEPENCPFCTDDAAPFRKDAERYRWLRESKQGCIRLDGSPNTPGDMRWANPQYIHWIDGVLDDVIDAAMGNTPAVGAA